MTNKPMLSVERELRGAIEQSLLAMKRIYQAGYEGIINAGGSCDKPGVMFENDPTARELRALLDKSQVEPGAPTSFDAAVKMCSHVYSFRESHSYLSFPAGISLHNACIALYHKGYRLPDEQRAPVAVVHTMKSIMEAVEASRCYTVLTSDQLHALAQSLNGVNK